MIEWRFHIDDLEIEQPGGFSDLVISLTREPEWHGIMFEAGAGEMIFYKDAADYLKVKKQTLGLKAEVIFLAETRCDEDSQFEEVVKGKLNFGRYKESCGNSCSVSLMVEQENCTMIMRNRYDQKVDIDSGKAFDGFTTLTNYAGLGIEMTLPARDLPLAIDGSVKEEGYDFSFHEVVDDGGTIILVRPSYEDERKNSIDTGQLIPASDYDWWHSTDGGIVTIYQNISPQLLYEEDQSNCTVQELEHEFRLKGNYTIQCDNATLLNCNFKVITWDGQQDINVDAAVTTLFEENIASSSVITAPLSDSFDKTFSGAITLPEGTALYCFIEIQVSNNGAQTLNIDMHFDLESMVNITTEKTCQPTDAKVNLINETVSRVVEAITNNCLKVKSNYYGRTDSGPYSSDSDGCGALRVVTSGLYIRKAEKPKHFLSLKDCFEGLNPIDNIGMGIEADPARPGYDLLRIEDVGYFYRDEEILSLPFVPDADREIDESGHYSLIKIGYEKWEIEGLNGLDEFNSTREYRTSLNSVNNTKTIVSKFVAGSYPWEITRQQSFAETGGADTKFDNETFIACVKRTTGLYDPPFEIEQGNITNPANIFSPGTVYNWRIRPFYNLMRWFKSLANSYAQLTDTDNKLFFSAGTGNITAEGEMTATDCKLENGSKAENRNLSKLDFVNEVDYLPLFRPEPLKFKYSLSLRDYKRLKENPFGFLSVQCGTGDYIKAFITTVKYSPIKGEADFNLKIKW